jgi:hypothetical protein
LTGTRKSKLSRGDNTVTGDGTKTTKSDRNIWEGAALTRNLAKVIMLSPSRQDVVFWLVRFQMAALTLGIA